MTGRRAKRIEPIPAVLLDALEREWLGRGRAALATLRETEPSAYIRLIARVLRNSE